MHFVVSTSLRLECNKRFGIEVLFSTWQRKGRDSKDPNNHIVDRIIVQDVSLPIFVII